jgi:hypothetical protein
MSHRLNTERQEKLEPKRLESCKKKLEELGFVVKQNGATELHFFYKGSRIHFYPYSGWHTGKTIKDGRGFQNLLKQLV